MRLSSNVYQISGRVFGTNSNTFAITTPGGIVLLDAGYGEKQLTVMKKALAFWNLDIADVCDVYLTHAHFDHVGNAARLHAMGKRLIASEADAEFIQNGGPAILEALFHNTYAPAPVGLRLQPGDLVEYGGFTITALDLAGHTPGAMAYLLQTPQERVLFTGDTFELPQVSPSEELLPELAFMGGALHDEHKYVQTLRALCDVDANIIAMGHGGVYYGDSCQLLKKVAAMAEEKYGF